MTIILKTERLILRRFIIEDLNDLFVLYSNPEIRRYFPDGVKNYEDTKEELEWFINGHPDHPELGLWATVHKETGKFIGRCGLLPWEIEGELYVEIAYLLGKTYWHQGFATEAALGIMKYGFENLNLSHLICMIHPENLASQRVAERIGMEFERKLDGIAGDNFSTLIYSISR